MKYSDNAMCAILLCSHIGLGDNSVLKPLTIKEWNNFLELMQVTGEEPKAVLEHDFKGRECFSSYPGMWDQICALLSRGGSVALELEGLEKKGIDIATLFDSDYPTMLKKRLQKKSPPLLFYAGNLDLAGKIGISITGSRSVDSEGLKFARQLAEKASEEKLVIYSGGAKGVDAVSEQIAVNGGGAAVSFIADSLLTRIRRKDSLDALMNGNLLLITDVNPDTGFSVARAMNRNKYIYTSGCGAFVVASDYGKGGTWAGATEAIRHEWTSVYAWNHAEYIGNQKLIEQGAIPYELSEEKLINTLNKNKLERNETSNKTVYKQLSLFDE